jgi:hypothetical protein
MGPRIVREERENAEQGLIFFGKIYRSPVPATLLRNLS